jgi:hypothetical protein
MHKYSYWWSMPASWAAPLRARVRYCPVGLDIRAMLRKASAYESEALHAN